MPLPPRSFWSIHEAAFQWGALPADVAGWAAVGKVEIVTSVPPVQCEGSGKVAGLVIVNATDLLPMFRRCGTGPREYQLHRIRPHDAGSDRSTPWLLITSPQGGVTVSINDLMITGAEVERLNEEWGLTKRGPGNPGGPKERYLWENFYVAMIKRIHEGGLPDTQQELVSEMQDWFLRRSNGDDVPDESTIRRRIKPIWSALREV